MATNKYDLCIAVIRWASIIFLAHHSGYLSKPINVNFKMPPYLIEYGENKQSRFEASKGNTIYPLERESINDRVRSP